MAHMQVHLKSNTTKTSLQRVEKKKDMHELQQKIVQPTSDVLQ